LAWISLNWIIFVATIWLGGVSLWKTRKKSALLKMVFWMGIVSTIVFQIIGVTIFKWWHFTSNYLSLFGIPLGIIIAWVFGTNIYVYFLPRTWYGQIPYLLLFCILTTLINIHFVVSGYQVHTGWSFLYTFLLALVVHIIETFLVIPWSGWTSPEGVKAAQLRGTRR
jgi:hypothetical protein